MGKKIKLIPRINSANGQINFHLKRTSFPKKFKCKLDKLKSLDVDLEDFEW